MRFIHLSDIHYSNDPDHPRVMNALYRDLLEVSKQKPVDAIFCTGDVGHQGNINAKSVQNIYEVLQKIREAVGKDVPLYLCPGNHDIDLNARHKIYQPIYKDIKSPESANRFILDAAGVESQVLAHTRGFLELARKLDPSAYTTHPLVQTHSLTLESQKVGVAILNSAWMTAGGGKEDYGNLYLGERQIDIALDQLSDCSIRIALMHHTLDWLSPYEKPNILRSLVRNFHALICGHNHDSSANLVVPNAGGTLFISNTGCIYQTRQYFNGYSVLDLDLEGSKWIVLAKEYYSQRDAFDISARFAPGGTKEFAIQDHVVGLTIVVPVTAIATAQERANSKLLSFSASDIAPKRVGAIFVEPPLAKVSEKELITQEELPSKNKSDEFITLQKIAESDEDILFVGKREAGKTTLLNHVVIDRFQDFHVKARIGFVVDLTSLIRFSESAVLEQAIESIGGTLRRSELIDILNHGAAVIGFDNALLHNADHLKLIEKFCEKYPGVRFVVAASEELLTDFSIDTPPNFNRQQLRVYIHSLKTKHTRALSCKWFGDEIKSQNSQKRLMWINAIVTRLRVPRTPFLISILLWVFEQKPTTHLVNQATTIEVLIDGLLDKFKESKSRADYDSTIQSYFLAELAAKLDSNNNEWVSSLEFEGFVVEFFKSRGLNASTRGFTEELLRKGLLYERAGQITFKFDCFRAFFLARKFAEPGDSWKKTISRESTARYVTELDILTGLYRDRKDILVAVRDLCQSLLASSGMDISLSRVEDLGKGSQLLSDESTIAALENGVLSDGFNDESRDEIVDMMHAPSEISEDHEASRQRRVMSQPSAQLQFVAALQAFSVVLRNSELIDDVNLKRECLNSILHLWAKFLIGSLDWIAKADENVFKQGQNITPEQIERIRLVMRVILPQAIVGLMSETLSTPKLETFIKEKVNDDETLIKTLAIFIALDDISPETVKSAKDLLKTCSKNTLIAQMLFFKLLELYITTSTSNSKAINLLRDCMSEAFVIFRGVKSLNANSVLKGQFLERLDDQRRRIQGDEQL